MQALPPTCDSIGTEFSGTFHFLHQMLRSGLFPGNKRNVECSPILLRPKKEKRKGEAFISITGQNRIQRVRSNILVDIWISISVMVASCWCVSLKKKRYQLIKHKNHRMPPLPPLFFCFPSMIRGIVTEDFGHFLACTIKGQQREISHVAHIKIYPIALIFQKVFFFWVSSTDRVDYLGLALARWPVNHARPGRNTKTNSNSAQLTMTKIGTHDIGQLHGTRKHSRSSPGGSFRAVDWFDLFSAWIRGHNPQFLRRRFANIPDLDARDQGNIVPGDCTKQLFTSSSLELQ